MKLITRDTDYAVRALTCIASEEGQVVSVTQLTRSLAVPRPFLRKILQILNKKGILNSYKGKGGGFSLAVPANEILLIDLMEIFQGPFKLNDHILKKKVCPNVKKCLLKKKLDVIETKLYKELEKITIQSLI